MTLRKDALDLGLAAIVLVLALSISALGQTVITETQELAPVPPLTTGVQFGFKAAVDASVGVAAVGDNGSTGSVYVFRSFGGAWLQEDQLSGQGSDDFGVCAVSGDVLAVGAPNRWSGMGGSNPGAVEVFRFDGAVWDLETTLLPPMGNDSDFGSVVVMHEDLLVVGDPDVLVGPTSWGAVYVYRDQGPAGWVLEGTLTSTAPGGGDMFGYRLATDGQTIAVGETGLVHVFRLVGGSWVLGEVLSPAAFEPGFGKGVAIMGDVLAMGRDFVGTSFGRVNILRFDGSSWIEEADLPGNTSASGFGNYLALGQDVLYAGQHNMPTGGIVRVYRLESGTWSETETLASTNADPSFGHPIALSGDTIIVGAQQEETIPNVETGAAYLFDLSVPPPPQFRRGDTNDDGQFNIADAIAALNALFGSDPVGCADSADANDDGASDIADAVSILSALFVTGTPPPPAPHPDCGIDPTPDPLGCAESTSCP